MKKAGIIFILAWLGISAGAEVPPEPDWITTFSNITNVNDWAKSCALDSAGYIYVTGNDQTGSNFYTIKYEPISGGIVWAVPFKPRPATMDQARQVACDRAGNLFVVTRRLIIKYDPGTGDTIFTRPIALPGYNAIDAWAGATDDSGHLYVAGSGDNGSQGDYVVIKYDAASGDTLWCQGPLPGGGYQYAYGCAVDPSGNPVITGNYGTVKLNSAGDTLWTRPYSGRSCCSDDSGNIYAAGVYKTYKLSPGGDSLWARDYSEIYACAADTLGYLYLAGKAGDEYCTIKCQAQTGDSLWSKVYQGTGNGADCIYGCAADGSGSLYVTGTYANPYRRDFLTIKYNAASGDTVWARAFNIPVPGGGIAFDCAAAPGGGRCYVVGGMSNADGGINKDLTILTYETATGTLTDTFACDSPYRSFDDAFACALEPSGDHLYVAGSSLNINYDNMLVKFDTNLRDTAWTRRLDLGFMGNSFGDCLLDTVSGDVFVITTKNDSIGIIIKYDGQSGDTIWTKSFDRDSGRMYFNRGALDMAGGFLYTVGAVQNGDSLKGYLVKCLASDGDTAWSRTYDLQSATDQLSGCCLDETGSYLYLCGGRVAARVRTSDGDTVWYRTYDLGAETYLFSCHLDGPQDNLFIAGTADKQYLILKLNAVQGDTVWVKKSFYQADSNDCFISCDLDGDGNIYITGWSYQKGLSYRMLTAKFPYVPTSVDDISTWITEGSTRLKRNRPNPFTDGTTIEFTLKAEGTAKLSVYNLLGQEVVTLADGRFKPGRYSYGWDGRDGSGRKVGNGVYFYQLQHRDGRTVRPMVLLK